MIIFSLLKQIHRCEQNKRFETDKMVALNAHQELAEGFRDFADAVFDVWRQFVRRGWQAYSQATYNAIAETLNFDDNGQRVRDVNGDEAPWVSAEDVAEIVAW